MKNKNDRTGMVNKGMGMMAAVVLTALLMAGCGKNNGDTESARDTNAGSVDMTEAQRAESNIEAEESSESHADTENITSIESQSEEIKRWKAKVHSWKSGLGITERHL